MKKDLIIQHYDVPIFSTSPICSNIPTLELFTGFIDT